MLSYLLTIFILHPLFYRKTLSELLEASNVPTIVSTSTTYSQESTPYNLRLPYKPAAIAVPETVAQIQAAIQCARKTHTKIAVRSGGHSYASHSLGGTPGSLILDLSYFSSVSLSSANTATVGAGTRLGNMATALWSQGKRACPHGTCPGVGISGHALLGGFGHTSRMWGLALDSIISLSVVLANSSLITVSATENPDLYWAFRGAGPSFGVVTELTLKTYPAPAPAHNIVYAYVYRLLDAGVLARAFMVVQRFGREGPPAELGIGVEVRRGGEFKVRGVYFGTLEEFNLLINPLISQLDSIYGGSAGEIQLDDLDWMESLHSMAEGKPMLTTPGEYNEHDNFFAKSLVEPAADPLAEEEILNLFTYLVCEGEGSQSTWNVVINLYGGPNSAIVQYPQPTSAHSTSCYGHRDCLFVFQFYASQVLGACVDSLVLFVEGMTAALVGGSGASHLGGYPGYIDPTLGAREAHEMYYGDAYPRLKEIKRRVDPEGLFWNPLAIGES